MSNAELRGQIDLLLLSVLAAGPAHGYRLIERLREQSDGAFDLTEGTVYPALHRLERSGLLESHWSDDAPRRRRVYAVTQAGRGSLETRRRDWAAFAGAMHAVVAQ
jgi:PadR family transcriptional regulator, regulatory protein PadR